MYAMYDAEEENDTLFDQAKEDEDEEHEENEHEDYEIDDFPIGYGHLPAESVLKGDDDEDDEDDEDFENENDQYTKDPLFSTSSKTMSESELIKLAKSYLNMR